MKVAHACQVKRLHDFTRGLERHHAVVLHFNLHVGSLFLVYGGLVWAGHLRCTRVLPFSLLAGEAPHDTQFYSFFELFFPRAVNDFSVVAIMTAE
jgi:hypothetical protein